jgi:hypothetical protein
VLAPAVAPGTAESEGSDVTQPNNPTGGTQDSGPSAGTADIPAGTGGTTSRDTETRGDPAGRPLNSITAARRAADEVFELTGQRPERVVSVAKHDDGWRIGLEIVELHRIPDSADVMAVYEVALDSHGALVTYRRERRYLRDSTDEYR